MAELLKWLDAYATGEEKVDAQHQMLFRMLNDFWEDIVADRAEPMLVVDLLRRYAKYHFGYEENCFLRHKCARHEQNKKAHEEFIRKLDDVKLRLVDDVGSDGRRKLIQDLAEWIVSWIQGHVIGIDLDLRRAMPSQPVTRS